MIFSLLTIKCSKWIYWNQLGRASRPSVRLLWTATSDSYRNGDASIQYHDDQHFYSILSVCDMSRNFIRPRGWHDVRILKIYYQSTQLLRTKANRFFPSVAAVSTHFSKYRASALGLVTAGSCLGMWPLQHLPHAKELMTHSSGGVIYPIVLQRLLSRVGFAWSVRILGFITLFCCCISIFTVKSRLPPTRRSGPWMDTKAFRDTRFALLTAGSFLISLGQQLSPYLSNKHSKLYH